MICGGQGSDRPTLYILVNQFNIFRVEKWREFLYWVARLFLYIIKKEIFKRATNGRPYEIIINTKYMHLKI